MAKTLYFANAPASMHRGTSDAVLGGTTSNWTATLLSESRGGGAVATPNRTTVTGPTNGVEVGVVGASLEWISEPLSADFTISGTITCNLWGAESSMSANVSLNAVIDKIDGATGALTRVATGANATELALTTATANNFTVTPTSTACKRGDRLRVRVAGDDGGGNQVGGFTFFFSYAGTTAAANGDSYIQFTESLTFEPAGDPGIFGSDTSVSLGTPFIFGFAATSPQQYAQSFQALGAVTQVKTRLAIAGAPTDSSVVEIQTNNAGIPSGTVVANVATVTAASLSTADAEQVFSGLSIALTPGTLYWLVFRRSGTLDNTNRYRGDGSNAGTLPFLAQAMTAGAWSTISGNQNANINLAFAPSTYYLTDTAETINPGSATEKKALTTRGSGSVSSITNLAAGPVTPIQVTATAGGTVIEWYTPALNAVTFGGKAKFNIRAKEQFATTDASLKAEIAVTAGDGTGATVWGTANIEAITTNGFVGELPLTEAAVFAWVAGDDTSITAGQRLRFRLYLDDPGDAPLGGSNVVTITYNGTTAAAAGDTYVILPVAVTEQTAAGKSLIVDTRRIMRNSLLRR